MAFEKKMLLVSQIQFGYHTDYYKYCKYLKSDFNIHFLCFDQGREMIEDEVFTQYISPKGNFISRNYRFIKAIILFLRQNTDYFVFVHYFRACSIIPILYRKRHYIHLDIRSGCVLVNPFKRRIFNFLMRYESYLFRSISIISDGLKKNLKVSQDAYILSLGADPIIEVKRPVHRLDLLYIGTLYNRHIDDTVEGLGIFIKRHPEVDIYYTIIGNGLGKEMDQIFNKIIEYGIEKYISLEGYVPNNELKNYLERANVGISYIPLTPYFEYQPPTKTFEYLMAGMPVIATGTYENLKIVNETNGLITSDNPISFAKCLEEMYYKINGFNLDIIKESVFEYKWETIVEKLKKFLLLNQTPNGRLDLPH